MIYNTFFKLYTNYLFTPIYFLIGLLFQIDKLSNDEMEKYYLDDEEYDEKKIHNYIMVGCKNDFHNLEKNNNIFVKKFITIDSELNKEVQVKYENILTLRENVFFGVDFYKPLHFTNLNYYLENKPELYTLYKLNIKTGDIIINAPLNSNVNIKEIIKNNYTEIINIFKYSDKYNKKDFMGWEHLYEQWIKPIEPSDKNNYLKLIQMFQDKKEIEVDENKYTQICCIRNFIQKDFFSNLKELYGNEESPFGELVYLFTTYRINNDENIITIVH